MPVQQRHIVCGNIETHVDFTSLKSCAHLRASRISPDLHGHPRKSAWVVAVGHQVHDVVHNLNGAVRIQARGCDGIRAREDAARLDVARWARLINHERPVGENDLHIIWNRGTDLETESILHNKCHSSHLALRRGIHLVRTLQGIHDVGSCDRSAVREFATGLQSQHPIVARPHDATGKRRDKLIVAVEGEQFLADSVHDKRPAGGPHRRVVPSPCLGARVANHLIARV